MPNLSAQALRAANWSTQQDETTTNARPYGCGHGVLRGLDAPKDAEPVFSPRRGTCSRLSMHLFLNMLKRVLKPWPTCPTRGSKARPTVERWPGARRALTVATTAAVRSSSCGPLDRGARGSSHDDGQVPLRCPQRQHQTHDLPSDGPQQQPIPRSSKWHLGSDWHPWRLAVGLGSESARLYPPDSAAGPALTQPLLT